MVRMRFGIRGIPILPNAATFVLWVTPGQAQAIRVAVEQLRAALPAGNHQAQAIAKRLFCEVEEK